METVLAHGAHSLFAGFVANHHCRHVLNHQFVDLRIHDQHFGQGFPALVSGFVAVVAALAVVKFPVADF